LVGVLYSDFMRSNLPTKVVKWTQPCFGRWRGTMCGQWSLLDTIFSEHRKEISNLIKNAIKPDLSKGQARKVQGMRICGRFCDAVQGRPGASPLPYLAGRRLRAGRGKAGEHLVSSIVARGIKLGESARPGTKLGGGKGEKRTMAT